MGPKKESDGSNCCNVWYGINNNLYSYLMLLWKETPTPNKTSLSHPHDLPPMPSTFLFDGKMKFSIYLYLILIVFIVFLCMIELFSLFFVNKFMY